MPHGSYVQKNSDTKVTNGQVDGRAVYLCALFADSVVFFSGLCTGVFVVIRPRNNRRCLIVPMCKKIVIPKSPMDRLTEEQCISVLFSQIQLFSFRGYVPECLS